MQVEDLRLINYTNDNKHAYHTQLERECDRCPNHDVKINIRDSNTEVGQEEEFRRTIGKIKVLRLENMKDLRLNALATSKNMVFLSTYFLP